MDPAPDYRGHNRNYGLTATLMPRSRVGFDFAYNYGDYLQNAYICFNDSDTTLSIVKSAGSCTTNGYNDSANPLLTNGIYSNTTNYGMGSITLGQFSALLRNLATALAALVEALRY